jgi:predicted Zn finger-like uncharacterized protein
MLFTRCPDCQTTFRITTDALHKANGQVRCGRCSNVFNAYADLRERLDAAPAGAPAPAAPTPTAAPSADAGNDTPGAEAAGDGDARPVAEHVVLETAAPAVGTGLPAAGLDDLDGGISADRVQAVLEGSGREPVLTTPWYLEAADEIPPERARRWQLGAVLALVLFVAQIAHHYRSDLARHATLGPAVQTLYSILGATVEPRWNVEQYELLEWIAAAEPNASGQGHLIITARIRNNGPRAQPHPRVRLRLLDRWENAVGTRVFRPDEYLSSALQANTMLEAGDTAHAQLVVVDPGPDAYGFELDICMIGDAGLDCATDDVFR